MIRCLSLAFFGLVIFVAEVFAAESYKITDLGSGTAFSINNLGEVVGQAGNGDAFSYSHGVTADLGELGAEGSVARSVNDFGLIVGQSYNSQKVSAGFRYSNGILDNLNASGADTTIAFSVNDFGQTVGTTSDGPGFIERGGVFSEIGTLGGIFSFPTAINNFGLVVGNATTADGTTAAFSYFNGQTTNLNIPGGAPLAVNDFGEIVGYDTGVASTEAFSYINGTVTYLGNLGGLPNDFGYGSYALGINDFGTVVGNSHAGGSAYKEDAFIYSNGAMADLNSLVDLSGTNIIHLSSATDINNLGQIVGEGLTANNVPESFLLTPIGVPDHTSTFTLLCLSFFGLIVFSHGANLYRLGERVSATKR